MSKPKDFEKWPPEKQAEWRKKRQEGSVKARAKKPEKYKAMARAIQKRNYPKNREKRLAALKEWKAQNIEHVRDYNAKWKKENEEQQRQYVRQNIDRVRTVSRTAARNLTDSVVALRLKIPVEVARQVPELIEAKRQEILLKREISKLK